MSDNVTSMRLGPEHPSDWWEAHKPAGDCTHCGSQCDGEDCGLHAAGCMFGGLGLKYWMIADGCPLWHGETPDDDAVPAIEPDTPRGVSHESFEGLFGNYRPTLISILARRWKG